MRSLIGTALAAAATAGVATAQPLPDPESTIVEELVVVAREPGPAWWRVRDGDTTVWILPIGEDRLPVDLAWDRRALERRMQGANVLIVGTRISISAGPRDLPVIMKVRSRLKSKNPLEASLPEPLRTRFVAARQRLGMPASRYAGWSPMIAGERLAGDARAATARTSVEAAVLRTAKRRRVKVVDPTSYRLAPFMRRAVDSLTPAVHRQCLEGALADIEAPSARLRAAAEGWARGDSAAALTEPRSFDKCVLLLGGGVELWRRARDDRAAAIEQALQAPGHAVAIVGLRQWLAEDGLATALEARGLTVLGPGEPDRPDLARPAPTSSNSRRTSQ